MNGHQPKGPPLDPSKIVPPRGGTGAQGPHRDPSPYPRANERVNGVLFRLRVPGGWVVHGGGGACFVPDAGYHWVLEPEQPVKPTRIPQPPAG